MTDKDKLILQEIKKQFKCRNNSEILLALEALCDKMRKKVSLAVVRDSQNFGRKNGIPHTKVDDDIINIQLHKDENKS